MSNDTPERPGLPERLPDVFLPPRVEGTLPDLPGETNLLPISLLSAALRVEFDQWGAAPISPGEFPATVHPYWDTHALPTKTFQYPFDTSELYFLVPEYLLAVEGPHRIKYRIASELYDDESEVTTVLIDWRAPSFNAIPGIVLLPPEVIANGITEEYLADNGGLLTVDIPHYSGTKTEDQIEFYWQHVPIQPGDDLIFFTHTVTADEAEQAQNDPASRITVNIPEAVIKARGQGDFVVKYLLKDRAGNTSVYSQGTPVTVDFTVTPVLAAPQVPAFNDGLINRADSLNGVQVQIGRYEWRSGDRFVVHWGAQTSFETSVGNSPVFPLLHLVPWEVLTVNGTSARETVPVAFSILRGPRRWRSPELSVVLDLTVAGPINPDPNPVNPRLARVTVKGRGGDNRIGDEDVGTQVKVELALYPDPNPGEELRLYWGQLAEPVARYTVNASDAGGDILEFFVPWQRVVDAGVSAAMPVRYLTFNGVNSQQSEDTLVTISFSVIEPTLPKVFYPKPEGAPHDWDERIPQFNCAVKPWRGMTVYLPADPRFVAGARIVFHWQGYYRENLTNSGHESFYVGDDFEVGPLDASAARDGVTFTLPASRFKDLIEPIGFKGVSTPIQDQNGSAEMWYTLYREGQVPITNKRRENYARISLIPPGGKCPCDRDNYQDDDSWCQAATGLEVHAQGWLSTLLDRLRRWLRGL